jgi:hypothetical protein
MECGIRFKGLGGGLSCWNEERKPTLRSESRPSNFPSMAVALFRGYHHSLPSHLEDRGYQPGPGGFVLEGKGPDPNRTHSGGKGDPGLRNPIPPLGGIENPRDSVKIHVTE